VPFNVVRKGTILIPSGTACEPDKKHLFVVCTDACAEGRHLLVPIASWTNDLCDATCKLAKGEHPFIAHPSYILYRKARIEAAAALIGGVERGGLSPQAPMNGQTFLRIANGVCRSPHTPRKIKVYAACP
jgi:hypothetical protein